MKKALIALLAVITITVGGLLVVPSFIDWSNYRAEITSLVKKSIDRELTVGGDIEFSILPSPVLRVSDISLSNASTGLYPEMIRMRQLNVEVALFPLIAGNINIQSIRLIEPEINLEILTNAQGNWIFGEQASTSQSNGGNTFSVEQNTSQNQNNQLPLQIDQFIIERGNINFTDQTTGRQDKIENLNARFSLAGLSGPFEAAGTLSYGDIPLGFEGNIGQIVNNRSASFAGLLKTAHGNSETRLSGTFIKQADGPRINAKIISNGQSLAGIISGITKSQELPIALDRPFSLETALNYQSLGLTFGENGLDFRLGEDHLNVLADIKLEDSPTFNIQTSIKQIIGDTWLNSETYKASNPNPLPLVIETTEMPDQTRGDKVSATLSNVAPSQTVLQEEVAETDGFLIPPEISGEFSASIDALFLKGDSIRQIQTFLSLTEGEIALERFSAVLPGAGDLSMFGVAGMTENGFGFDGSLELNIALLKNALKWAGIDLPKVSNDRLQQMTLSADIIGHQSGLDINNLAAQIDTSKIAGKAAFSLGVRPKITTDFTIDRINLDNYIAPASNAPIVSREPSNPNPTPNAPQTEVQEELIIPSIEFLEKLNADLSFAVGSLRYRAQDVSGLILKSQIENGSIGFSGSEIKDLASLSVKMNGAVKPVASTLSFENLSLNVKGRNIEKALILADLQNTINARQLGNVDVTALLNGPLLKPDLKLNGLFGENAISADTKIAVFPSPKVMGKIELDAPRFNRLANAIAPDYQASGRINLKTELDLTATDKRVRLENISANLNGTPIKGTILTELLNEPRIDANIRTGRLDLTPLFSANQNRAASKPSTNNRNPSGTSSQRTDVQEKWSSAPFDLSGIEGLELIFDLDSDAIKKDDIIAEQVIINARLKDGIATISQKSANIFGGPLESKTRLETQPVLTASTEIKTGTLNLGRALQQIKGEQLATGQITLNTNLASQGNSEKQLVQNLNGQLSAQLSKVNAAKGKNNPGLQLFNLLSTLSGRDPSKGVADVAINSNIQNGVARLTTANLTSSVANGNATGQVNLPNWTIDVEGNIQVAQNALVGLIAQQTKMKSDYPFSIKGLIDDPTIKLDTGSRQSGGGLVIPIPEQLDRKGVGNLLRGVLGGAGVQTTPQETAPAQPTQDNQGTIAPPPPPPGTSNNSNQNNPPSVEEQLLRGLGNFLQNR